MAFQPLTKEQYDKAIQSGFTPQQIIANEVKRKAQEVPAPVAQPGYVSRVASDVGANIADIGTNLVTKQNDTSFSGAVGKGLNIAKNITTAAVAPIAEAPGFKQLGQLFNWAGQGISDQLMKNPTYADAATKMATFLDANPGVGDALATANNVLQLQGVKGGIESGVAGVKSTIAGVKTINAIADTLPKEPPPTPILNEAKVTDLYSRAIKPTVAGKVNANQIASGNTRVISGMQSIADNKPNLTFTDVNGETITGQTPRTVDQFSQAITQTKSSIFTQYDALAKQAGEQGVVVNAPKIALELDPVINSSSLRITNPKAVAYARDLQARLIAEGGIDAVTAQEVISNYNESLKAFYRNPTYENASQASIDALIANKFREQLDAGITNATGAQYQALKNQYGALAAMEKDVAHRAMIWGRQNAVGLAGNLANITSGAELVRGLITLNPADIAASVAIKGIQKYIQYLNNPDVGVQRIFSEINRASPPATGSTILPKVEGKVGKP